MVFNLVSELIEFSPQLQKHQSKRTGQVPAKTDLHRGLIQGLTRCRRALFSGVAPVNVPLQTAAAIQTQRSKPGLEGGCLTGTGRSLPGCC